MHQPTLPHAFAAKRSFGLLRQGGVCFMLGSVWLLSACEAGSPSSWPNWHGFYPGMPLSEAQTRGVRHCSEHTQAQHTVTRCILPPSARHVGPLRANAGDLLFDGANPQAPLLQLRLHFVNVAPEALCEVLSQRFGEPLGDAASTYIWRRPEQGHFIRSSPQALATVVTFQFNPNPSDAPATEQAGAPQGCRS